MSEHRIRLSGLDFGLRLSKGFIEWLARIKAPELFEALESRARA